MNEYEQAKQAVVAALIVFLQAGDKLGKTQGEMSMEFMAAFAQAAQEAQAAA